MTAAEYRRQQHARRYTQRREQARRQFNRLVDAAIDQSIRDLACAKRKQLMEGSQS